jgi:hypothetical protein
MILLDTGVSLLGLGFLTFLVVISIILIEAAYINRFIKRFWFVFWITLIVNIITTFLGYVLTLCCASTIAYLISWITNLFTVETHRGYLYGIIVLIVYYVITIIFEIPLFKCFFKDAEFNLSKEVAIANLLSYLLIAILYFIIAPY